MWRMDGIWCEYSIEYKNKNIMRPLDTTWLMLSIMSKNVNRMIVIRLKSTYVTKILVDHCRKKYIYYFHVKVRNSYCFPLKKKIYRKGFLKVLFKGILTSFVNELMDFVMDYTESSNDKHLHIPIALYLVNSLFTILLHQVFEEP